MHICNEYIISMVSLYKKIDFSDDYNRDNEFYSFDFTA